MSRDERRCNSILLKERYRLVSEEAIDKRTISFNGKSLYINRRLHGSVGADGFIPVNSIGNSVPSLINLGHSISEETPSIDNITPPTTNQSSESPSDD